MALYQKYRSKKFEDVLTQGHVKDILQTSIKNNTFGHAYLFVGTRGTGKTSIARIFARAINCQNEDYVKESGEPCNECESCKLALAGSHIDIIEMDAASNRGIEEVRSIKEAVDFLPSIGKYKVYIIDEAHMMTKEAFNALLKTIEEPPKHVVFIMCTTELFKLPATIISRSQVFELKHATIDQLIEKIDKIIAEEGFQIDLEGKKLIAKLGKGSFRDTESILEKVLHSSKAQDLHLDAITEILGLSSLLFIENLKSTIYAKDLVRLQDLLDSELDEGSIMNVNLQLANSVYEDITASLHAHSIDPFIFELFDFLASVDKDIKNTTNPKIIYIAKLLNFTKNFVSSPQKTHSASITPQNPENNEEVPVRQSISEIQEPKKTVDLEKLRNNPAAMMRHKSSIAKASEDKQIIKDTQETTDEKPKKFVSKLDFLGFLQERNAFLFRFFSHHDFEFKDDKLFVDVSRQMEKDLLTRPQTQSILIDFGGKFSVGVKLEFAPVKVDMRKTEEKVVKEVTQKVEDLSDTEIKQIFNVKN